MTINFSGGSGSETDPYMITTPQQLAELAQEINKGNTDYYRKCYKLGADIDLSAYGENFNDGKGWIPIGVYQHSTLETFQGVFDGNQHTISNLYINNKTNNLNNQGLFGVVSGGTVKNLGVVNVNINGVYQVGGVAGLISASGTVSCCFVTGKINCMSGGGIVGIVIGNIANCYSTAEIGGSGTCRMGGVVGHLYDNTSKVTNCYSAGAVIYDIECGGITGKNEGNPKVTHCVALNPSIQGSELSIGRVAGKNGGVMENNAAYNGMLLNNKQIKSTDATSEHGADMDRYAIHRDGTLGGRFTQAGGWTTANGKLPGLFGKTVDMPPHLLLDVVSPPPNWESSGAQTDPHLVTTAQQLASVAQELNRDVNNYNNKYYLTEIKMSLPKLSTILNDTKQYDCDGRYPGDKGNEDAIYFYSLLFNSFTRNCFEISFDFLVEKNRKHPVLMLSRNWRILGFYLFNDGSIEINTNNHAHYYPLKVKYNLNTWHKVALFYQNGLLTVKFDRNPVETFVIDMNTEVGDNVLSSVDYGIGNAFLGSLRNIVVKTEILN